jgi:hypothetical protein
MFNHILDYYAYRMLTCPWADRATYNALSRAYFVTSVQQVRA